MNNTRLIKNLISMIMVFVILYSFYSFEDARTAYGICLFDEKIVQGMYFSNNTIPIDIVSNEDHINCELVKNEEINHGNGESDKILKLMLAAFMWTLFIKTALLYISRIVSEAITHSQKSIINFIYSADGLK